MTFLLVGNGGTTNRGCEAIPFSTMDILDAVFTGSRYINCSYKDDRVHNTPYLQKKCHDPDNCDMEKL